MNINENLVKPVNCYNFVMHFFRVLTKGNHSFLLNPIRDLENSYWSLNNLKCLPMEIFFHVVKVQLEFSVQTAFTKMFSETTIIRACENFMSF